MNNKIKLFLLFLAGSFACKTGPNQSELDAQQQAWEEMMAIHDEVMPKMSEMNQVVREFTGIEEKEQALFEQYRERILASKERIEAAEEAMFSWMNEIKQLEQLRETMSHEEILAYLAAEKEKISKVKADMLGSLEGGFQLLSEFEDLSQQENQE